MFKNIIFDWSGVVKDALPQSIWVVTKMMQELGGKEIPLAEFQENWVQPYMKFWNKYFPNLDLETEQKMYHETLAREDCPKTGACPGMAELIKALKNNGLFLAVVSSDHPRTLLPEIMEYDLENVFNEVVTNVYDKTEGAKGIIEKSHLKKEETVIIGDSNHEVEIGKHLGIKTIAVTWGFSTEKNLKALNPDYLVHNVKELEKILLK